MLLRIGVHHAAPTGSGRATGSSRRTRQWRCVERLLLEVAVGRKSVGQLAEVDQVAVELGPVHAGVRVSPPTLTRQPPHMPVPSTMIGLSETTVGTPSGRVSSTTARIIGTGPTA